VQRYKLREAEAEKAGVREPAGPAVSVADAALTRSPS
jgi:hypothetical protein